MSPWTTLSFEGSAVNSLPLNWQQYSSDGSTNEFAVTAASPPTPALSGTHNLTVTDPNASGDEARAWLNESMPADVQVSSAVYVNGGIHSQVIARGSNLDLPDTSTSGPSFYAAQLSASGTVLELVKDVNGTFTSLASITSSTYVNDAWMEETLDVEGSTVRAQLFYPNYPSSGEGEYLNSSGKWQSTPTWALTVIDNSISGPGVVGVGRGSSYTGTLTFDDFAVQTPATDQSFDAAPTGQLPENWSNYSTNSNDTVAVTAPASPIAPISGPNVLGITAVGSGDSARAWLNTSLPADLSASAYAYIEATPAQVFARGINLNLATPTYYAVEVSEGGVFRLVKVVGGTPTVLKSATSTSYINNIWVQETLGLSGDNLYAQLYRPDTQQYMDGNGNWQTTPTWAFQTTDSSITAGGQAGVGRLGPAYVGNNYFDDFTTATSMDAQTFDASTSLTGWSQWSSDKGNQSTYFAVASAPDSSHFLSASNVLENTSGSVTSQIWNGNELLTNAQVSAGMYLPNTGTQLIARGTGLGTSSPSYYGLSVTTSSYGMTVNLVRVNNGASTTLAQISPLPTYQAVYFNDQWIQTTLYVDGPSVRAQIYRADTGQYLNGEDEWQSDPTYALNVTDTSPQALTAPGYGGLVRQSGFGSGTYYFDNVAVTPLSAANTPPSVSLSVPSGTLTNTVTVSATPSSNIGISKVDFYVEDNATSSTPTVFTHWEEATGPYNWSFDTTFVPNGTHTLVVMATDTAGNIGEAMTSITVSNNTTLTLPSFTRHQSNIGIAETDYGQNAYNSQLLQNNVDVVVNAGPDLSGIYSIAPNTPQLLYTNVSNLYNSSDGDLLTAWLNYAEENSIDPEQAFYHVSVATPWVGDGGSTQPVDWFWGVYAYQNGQWQPDLTAAAHASPGTNGVSFGNGTSVVGDTLNVGYTDKFREIDVALSTGGTGGSYVLEYPTAVDSSGNPTAWSTLTAQGNNLSDGTNGLTTSGTITFDPPSNWVPAVVDSNVSGTARYYYVRFRTTAAFSTIPVASTILGYNYTGAVSVNGTNQIAGSYTIPAFDYAADTDHDGYLNAQEYAHRAPGMDAYFAYQGRLFTTYGQMRFETNPSSPAFRQWAFQYYPSLLSNPSNKGATGLFVDNSENNPPGQGSDFNVLEPTDSYTQDYASLLNAIGLQIAPNWIMANILGADGTTGGSAGQTNADPVIQKVQAYYEERSISAPIEDTTQFLNVYNRVYYRDKYDLPSYAVLDSSASSSGDPNVRATADQNGQNQLTTLAAYYLLAPTNPSQGALDFFGGENTSTPWVQSWSLSEFNHWSQAAAYNVGTPVSGLPQTPDDFIPPGTESDGSTYHVYDRHFTGSNGQPVLVLYKPISEFSSGQQSQLTGSASASTITLGGSYYVLQANGTLSSTAVTTISLDNGEGAILVQAGTLAPQIAVATMIADSRPTSPAAPTAYITPAPSGASPASQGSAGPTTANSLAAVGQVPVSLPAEQSDLAADLDRIFSLWSVAKIDLDHIVSAWTMAKMEAVSARSIGPSSGFGPWLGSTGLSKAHGNSLPFDDSFGEAAGMVADW